MRIVEYIIRFAIYIRLSFCYQICPECTYTWLLLGLWGYAVGRVVQYKAAAVQRIEVLALVRTIKAKTLSFIQ